MHYSAYTALVEDLTNVETLTKYYSGIHRFQFSKDTRSNLKTDTVKEKIEQTIFEIVCRIPKHLPALISEMHINAIENPIKCKRYIEGLIAMLSRHSVASQLGIVKPGKELPNRLPKFGADDYPEGDLLFSELIPFNRPDYKTIRMLRWTATYVLLMRVEGESNYRLSNDYYEPIEEQERIKSNTGDNNALKANSINERLVVIKEIGFYKLMSDLGLANERIAKAIGYLIDKNPNTITPLLTKIEYKKLPKTGNKPEIEAAKKNNPYTKRAILNAFETLTRLGIQQSEGLTTAYKEAVSS